MKKYYTFRAGKPVPKWMVDIEPKFYSREDNLHNAKHCKVIFSISCVAIRESCKSTILLPISKSSWRKGVIQVSGIKNAFVGGVGYATGTDVIGKEVN